MGDNVTNDLIGTGLCNEVCLGADGIMPSIKALCRLPPPAKFSAGQCVPVPAPSQL